MPYLGKTELKSSDVIADSFTGNGSTTAFTLSKVPPSEQAVLVSINGVKQHTDAYSISGTTLTLSAAPDSGDAIEAVSIIDIGESAGDSLPTQTGNSGKFLTTDGADSSWGALTTDLVEDLTPQLGGDLDTNGKNISFGDSSGSTDDRLTFGASDDLQIYHDGSHGRIRNSTGTLKIQVTANGENAIEMTANGKTAIFHNGVEKLATTDTGINVTGSVTADGVKIEGDGTSSKGLTIKKAGQQEHYIFADGPIQYNTIGSSSHTWVWKQEGGTERMRIDSSGRVTMPYQPAFLTSGSGGWTPISSGNSQLNTWQSPSYQRGSGFSSSTGKYTAPVGGLYQFVFGNYTRVANSSSYTYPRIFKNGAVVTFSSHIVHYGAAGDADTGHTLTVLINLAANDYIQAGFYLSGSGDYHQTSQSFQGHLIG